MKLTILGSCAATPSAGRACSGYLVQEGPTHLLLDCGSGVLSNLQKVLALHQLTDIVISHMHFDHFGDLIPLGYWRTYGPQNAVGSPPRLHLPPGGKQAWAGIVGQVVGASADSFQRAFSVAEYQPSRTLTLGTLRLSFALVPHYVPSYAVAISQDSELKLAYSADEGPTEILQRLARSTPLLLCEATLDAPEASPNPGHMTASQAAEIAKAASVGRLVLTHFWPWQDRRQALAEASSIFGEGVIIAEEGDSYTL